MLDSLIQMRLAEEGDMQRIFIWANDPLVRAMSFNSEPISWDEHQTWFTTKLDDLDTLILIAEYLEDGKWVAVGQVRFDHNSVISISIDEVIRGKGFGTEILQKAIDFYEQTLPNKTELIAYIRPQNEASIKLFMKADFVLVDEIIIVDQPGLKFALNCATK